MMTEKFRSFSRLNVSLQLTGAGNEEVVVATALARTVSRQHLPCRHVARS